MKITEDVNEGLQNEIGGPKPTKKASIAARVSFRPVGISSSDRTKH